MKPETTTILYEVGEKLTEVRKLLDDYMYGSGGIPNEDHKYCRRVYDSVCKSLDLL